MKIPTLVFLFIIIFCKINAQEAIFEQVSKHTFRYKDRVGDLHTFKDVMLLDSANLYGDFYNFNKNRKGQKVMNVVTSIALVPFLVGGYLGFSGTNESPETIGLLILTYGVVVSFIGFGINEITYIKAKNKYRRLLLDKVLEPKKETSSLRLSTTPSGIGLVYQF
jgi:hypothetical protein